jgi:predicted nucleic acid-binding protein
LAIDGEAVKARSSLPIDVRDEKDERVLEAALGGRADYLVTGDNDLLVLAGDPRLGALRIVTARAFLELLARPA